MIRIALIDDEEAQLSRFSRLMGDVFIRQEIKPVIKQHLLDGKLVLDSLLDKISRQLKEDRPHIIICDNKIGLHPAAGQFFLAALKLQFPEAVTCLLTREKVQSDQFGIRVPNPDIIISKGPLGGADGKYREYVGEQIFKFLTHKSNISVAWATPFHEIFTKLKDSKGRKATEGEIISLIEQCLYDKNLVPQRKNVAIRSLQGGKSGSVVLSCHLAGDFHYGVTAVIKISKKESAKTEVANYETYVKWVLPYTWKIEVLGTGETEGFGAVCYSFAFDGESKPVSCTELLRQADLSVTSAVCKSIFNPKSKIWYDQVRHTGKDAGDYFQQSPFFQKPSQITEREDHFLRLLKSEFGENFSTDDEYISLFSVKTKRASHKIFTEDWGDVEECISHGDLNSSNILMNERQGVAFIDFQHTGFHNIFRDFVSYESSVRIEYSGDLSIRECASAFAKEMELASGRYPDANGYLRDIIAVRQTAFLNFATSSSNDRRNVHLIAAYIHFSWLVTRFEGEWTAAGSRRLMIGAFAALATLGQYTST
jgi:hypothetical protein